jgi:hypothetical protein
MPAPFATVAFHNIPRRNTMNLNVLIHDLLR